ncbi:MAG: tetratricopeptide repeat protein [Thermoflexales bacterium]|nr:tetratricopeptide repeat protein [Thermoflexales bacterium]
MARSTTATAITAVRGLPGAGKTTLAAALAHSAETHSYFVDGVLWVGLGRSPDLTDGLRRWASALGMDIARFEHLPNQTAQIQALHDRIGTRRMLLIVDDAWSAEAALAFRLGGPRCAHVLTTRFAGIAHDFAMNNVVTVEELSPANGLRLFSAIASQVAKAEPAETRRLIAIVGGLPLAVSLAARAAWKMADTGTKAPVQELISQLEAGIGLGPGQPMSPLERPPSLSARTVVSLDAVIALSFETLSEAERRMLVAMAIHTPKPDTFSRAAGCAVGGCSMDSIDRLIDSGLLEVAGDDRLTIHQTIADFASRLERDTDAPVRLIEHYTGFARENVGKFPVLDRDLSNILHATDLARRHQFKLFSPLVSLLYRFFVVRGQFSRGLLLEREAYELCRSIGDEAGMATSAMHIGNFIRLRLGDRREAETWLREAIRRFEALGSISKQANTLLLLGYVLQDMQRLTEADEHFSTAIEIGEKIGEHDVVADGLNSQGVSAVARGDNDGADVLYQRALEIGRRNDFHLITAVILGNLGNRMAERGDFIKAATYFDEGVKISQRHGFTHRVFRTRMDWGGAAIACGAYDEAEFQFRSALTVAEQTGSHRSISEVRRALGKLAHQRGHTAEAERHFEEALQTAISDGLEGDQAATLFERAKFNDAHQRPEQALTDANKSLAIWTRLGEVERLTEIAAWLANRSAAT